MRSIRTRILAVAATVATIAALAPAGRSVAVTLTGPTTNLSKGITFEHSNMTDPVRLLGEPDIALDSKGAVYSSGPGGTSNQTSWFWKSDDNGIQWHSIGVIPEAKPNGQNGGGDTEIAIARNNDVYGSDLQSLACNSTFRSTDEGKTFLTSEGCLPGTDRQWQQVYDPNASLTGRRIYFSANQLGLGCYVLVSTDGGVTYVPPAGGTSNGVLPGGPDCFGRFAVDPANGHIFVPTAQGTFRSTDGGVTWANVGNPHAVGNLFSTLVIDTAGNLYQAWVTSCGTTAAANPCKAFVSYSLDRGVTWHAPIQVNTGLGSPVGTSPDLHRLLFPWIVVGDPGRVAIVYYGTTDSGGTQASPGSAAAKWRTYGAFSTNLLDDANRSITQTVVDEHVMHAGTICNNGTGCATSNGDRSLADFFEVDKDPRDGRVFVVYNDGADVSSVTKIGKVYVMVSRQRTGPSLFAAKGNLLPPNLAGAVGIASATTGGGNVTVIGTHGLPPGNWNPDPAGDATFPVVPAAGPNNPALDIREASVSDDGTNLIFKMRTADLSAAAQAAAAQSLGNPSWLFTWWSAKGGVPVPGNTEQQAHWFVRWLGGTAFVYGNVGAIDYPTLGTPAPLFLTYNPSGTATGSVDTATNTVTISVPKSVVGNPVGGEKIDHVTPYTWVDRTNGIPSVVDQAKSFAYRFGTPASGVHRPDGYVEVQIDSPGAPGNPTFPSPSLATLDTTNGWTFTAPDPGPGQHTVCARQVLSADLYNPGLWDDVQAGLPTCLTFGSAALPSLTIDDVSHNEGNAGTTPYTFTVTISPALTGVQTASVHIVSSDGSATSPSDYMSVLDTVLSFDAAHQTRTVTVNVNGDTSVEPDEQFSMILIGPIGAQIGDGQGTGTIVNDDSGGTQCTQTGTDGNDTLQGTSGDDVLCGLGGNDTIFGKGGNDTLLGGDDIDVLNGGPGADSLYGEDGNDTLTPGLGDDPVVDGGFGSNSVTYSDATSAVTVDLVNQTATGGGGTDSLSGIVNATGSKFDDHLIGDGQVNILDGGTAGIDLIDAGDGNDVLVGGSGTDTLNGGAGTDSAKYTTSPAGVTVDLGAGTASNDGYGTADTLSSIEDAQGSNVGGDSITGSSVKNKIYGNGGGDQLFGLGANDLLYGGAGADAMDGGANTDTCDGGADTDTATNCESTPNVP